MESKYLKKWAKELDICIRCAYCFEDCPVFKELEWESSSARAKVVFSYGLLYGEIEPSKFIADRLFDCTLCKICTEKCSANVHIADIVESCRAELVRSGFAYPGHKVIVNNVKDTGNIFGDKEVKFPVQEGEIPLFIGCQYLSRPNKTKMWIRILEKLGINPKVVKETCCGFPLKALGFMDELQKQADRFKELFPYKELITLCPTCTYFLREEYGLNAKHVLEAISEKLDNLDNIETKKLDMKVTYHDPCDLARGIGVIEEPRQILNRIGVEVVELGDNRKLTRCCGGGGGMLISDVDLSDEIAKTRVRQAIKTGADTLVTACPTCEQVLKKAAAAVSGNGEGSITVRNMEDVLWKALR
jgi:Fe-S oxidoreductase